MNKPNDKQTAPTKAAAATATAAKPVETNPAGVKPEVTHDKPDLNGPVVILIDTGEQLPDGKPKYDREEVGQLSAWKVETKAKRRDPDFTGKVSIEYKTYKVELFFHQDMVNDRSPVIKGRVLASVNGVDTAVGDVSLWSFKAKDPKPGKKYPAYNGTVSMGESYETAERYHVSLWGSVVLPF